MDKDEKIVESRKLDSLLQKRLRQDYCSASLRPQLREGDYQLTEMPLWEKAPMRPIMHDKLCRNVEDVCSGAAREGTDRICSDRRISKGFGHAGETLS